ncbi:hypothetical protein [Mesorhizobium sp.]|uniref:hypothetical protein n=1 Tax=Mesorhizobium sp. TaxID=1871066 RepID=UPI000FE5D30F|nr:hypothetical protein [Mesorhizobium sp.]RWF33738.1 MAG: hypothetical protein EOS45_02060 [Mesorhizobium sp.]
MDDAELGVRLVRAIRNACQSNKPDGKPVKGKLTGLALNITSDRWQAISQFWLTNDRGVKVGSDPILCLLDVLETQPDLSVPYEPALALREMGTDVRPAAPNAVAPQPALANYPTAQEDDVLDLSDSIELLV